MLNWMSVPLYNMTAMACHESNLSLNNLSNIEEPATARKADASEPEYIPLLRPKVPPRRQSQSERIVEVISAHSFIVFFERINVNKLPLGSFAGHLSLPSGGCSNSKKKEKTQGLAY